MMSKDEPRRGSIPCWEMPYQHHPQKSLLRALSAPAGSSCTSRRIAAFRVRR